MINVRTNIDTYKYKAPNVSHIYVLRAYIFMPIWSELIWFRFMSNNFPHILSLTHSLPCSFLLFCWYPRGPNNPIIIHINVVISIIHIVAHPFYCCASCSFPLSQSTHTLTLTQFSRLGFFFQFHPFKSLFSCRYFRFSFFVTQNIFMQFLLERWIINMSALEVRVHVHFFIVFSSSYILFSQSIWFSVFKCFNFFVWFWFSFMCAATDYCIDKVTINRNWSTKITKKNTKESNQCNKPDYTTKTIQNTIWKIVKCLLLLLCHEFNKNHKKFYSIWWHY